MTAPSRTVTQDPQAHLYYDLDWSAWLAARDYTENDIVGFTWTVPATITQTQAVADDAVARIYLKDATLGARSRVTCRIEVTAGDGAPSNVADEFSFTVLGAHR